MHLAELVERWGVEPARMLHGTGLDEATLADPKARITVPVLEELATRAKALTGEPGLGFYLGLSMRASSHGFVGLAAMASGTVREALDLAVRFGPTRTDVIALRTHVGGGVASIVVEELHPLGAAQDIMILSLLVGFHAIGEAITGKPMMGSADIAFPEPAYVARFPHVVRGGIRFGQPSHQLVFDEAVLDLPLVMADKGALALARAECERDLAALGFARSAAGRVRELCARRSGGLPSLDEAASALALSSRTLKRRLAEEGTGFGAILDEQRKDRALLLLRSGELSVEAVAERVGYSDVANFTRAFRRWTGATPTAFRKSGAKAARR
jgi:AraC-like DNA-binding protein